MDLRKHCSAHVCESEDFQVCVLVCLTAVPNVCDVRTMKIRIMMLLLLLLLYTSPDDDDDDANDDVVSAPDLCDMPSFYVTLCSIEHFTI